MSKILFVAHDHRSLILFRLDLINKLISSGNDITILIPVGTLEYCIKNGLSNVRLYEYPINRSSASVFNNILTFLCIIQCIRKINPTLVFSFSAKTNIFSSLSRFFSNVKKNIIMIEGLGFIASDDEKINNQLFYLVLKKIALFTYKVSCKLSEKIIVLNSSDQKFVENMFGIKSDKIFNIGGIGVSLDEWQFSKIECINPTFIMASRLLREKGVLYYLEAAFIIRKYFHNINFILLGDFDSNPTSLSFNDILPYIESGTIQYMGYADVKSYLIKSSVFVLPTYYNEGVPRTIQEAMAVGRAIITTDIAGCNDAVSDGVNGFLIQKHDVNGLVNSMIKFIENPNLILKMGCESRRIAEEKFNNEIINANICKIFFN